MMTRKQRKNEYRNLIAEEIETSEVFEVVKFETWPRDGESCFLDDVYDAHGDSIKVSADFSISMLLDGLVQAMVPRGTCPRYAARVLRKYADMLDGPRGHELTNLSWGGDDPHEARFDEAGYLHIFNVRKLHDEHERENRGDAGADE